MRRSWMMIAVGLLVAVFAIGAVACDDDDDGNGAEATATAEDGAGAPTATTEAGGDDPTATEEPADGAGATVIVTENATLGAILTDADGNTLYTFAEDGPGVSTCQTDPCPQTWPPLTIGTGDPSGGDGATGTFGSIDTAAGKQVTYDSAPLYYFAADAPGDTKGHLVGERWFVARPDTASTSVVGVAGSGAAAHLVGPTGMTLYLFANDSPGTSNCASACLENWPALTVPEGQAAAAVDAASGEVGVIERADGTFQVTYNGAPLYHFANDTAPGDTNGQGIGGLWFVVEVE